MKIGIIYCCYGNPEYIEPCLEPWLSLKEKHNIKIAAVHGQFKEYHDLGIKDDDAESASKLCNLSKDKVIDHLYIQNDYVGLSDRIYQTEAEIRDKGLQWLLGQKCDIIWLLDNDERYTVQQIENIIEYFKREDNLFYSWFSIPFKNYIFSGKEWISGFCPPRIFKRETIRYSLVNCYWDNDFNYKNDLDEIFNYKWLASKKIPEKIVDQGIKHLTWLHSVGKKKVEYQKKHFKGDCSYKWNEAKQELEFDLNYYNKHNLNIPEIHID